MRIVHAVLLVVLVVLLGVTSASLGYMFGVDDGRAAVQEAAVKAGVAEYSCDKEGACRFEFKKFLIPIAR